MFPQCSQIIERDDGLFQIGIGDDAPGPFDSRAFAERVANGEKPANIRNDTGGKFRRFRIVREVRNAASA